MILEFKGLFKLNSQSISELLLHNCFFHVNSVDMGEKMEESGTGQWQGICQGMQHSAWLLILAYYHEQLEGTFTMPFKKKNLD